MARRVVVTGLGLICGVGNTTEEVWRNLLAGNGPVFNQGERVEANTSTIWTYLLYVLSWVGEPMRLEYVALAAAWSPGAISPLR